MNYIYKPSKVSQTESFSQYGSSTRYPVINHAQLARARSPRAQRLYHLLPEDTHVVLIVYQPSASTASSKGLPKGFHESHPPAPASIEPPEEIQ